MNSQSFDANKLACEKVTVYRDRAELKRRLRTKLKHGENELIITNLSHFISKDSIRYTVTFKPLNLRLQGFESCLRCHSLNDSFFFQIKKRVDGQGKANVLDVVCNERHVPIEQTNKQERTHELNREIERNELKLELLAMKRDRLLKSINLINEYATCLTRPSTIATQQDTNKSTTSIETFMSFLQTYQTKIETLDEELFNVKKEIEKITEALNAARNNLGSLQYGSYELIIEIKILIEAEQDETDISLLVSYLVTNASWSPKYDIRVHSDTRKMTINYYGIIQQTTKEDWNETRICLSTANPALGGNVPELETLNVRLRSKHVDIKFRSRSSGSFMSKKLKAKQEMAIMSCDTLMCEQDEYDGINESIQQLKTNVTENVTSSTFDIPRKATIPSDSNNTHKVTIGIINLEPEFEYETVPKKCAYAFLKAKVKNTSAYTLLAGQANVFMDNCFVASTHLNTYNSQEEFSCSLGIDESIKIDYKPLKKYKEQSGLINKTTSIYYEQIIDIKNNSLNAIKLCLKEQLPLSNDDKTKVNLIEPNLKTTSHMVKLNEANNLEFNLKLDSGKTQSLKVKYSIEYPAYEDVEFF